MQSLLRDAELLAAHVAGLHLAGAGAWSGLWHGGPRRGGGGAALGEGRTLPELFRHRQRVLRQGGAKRGVHPGDGLRRQRGDSRSFISSGVFCRCILFGPFSVLCIGRCHCVAKTNGC